jgi:hypothetical protein
LPLIWYFYVETATLSLEEVDRLFEIKYENGDTKKNISYSEATRLAKEQVQLTKLQIAGGIKENQSVRATSSHNEELILP